MSEPFPFVALGLDHVVLRVRDRERMLRFYTEVLGCTLEREQPEFGLTQLRAGTSLIDLVTVPRVRGLASGDPPGAAGHNVDHICIAVHPFDDLAIRRHLARHGVKPGATALRYGAGGEGPSIYLEDPEGNGIELKADQTVRR